MQDDRHIAWPAITVAVCVRNGEAVLGACLDSLMKLDYPNENLSILVVDNGSTDGTADIISRYPVILVREPRKGRGHARNVAWRSCETPLIAFTDADCRVTPEWLKDLVPAFEDPDVGAAGGDIVTPGNDPMAQFFEKRRIVSNREFSGNYPYSPPFLATANALFRVEAIQTTGGFQSHYGVAEDADICWRIQNNGWTLKYLPCGTVYHDHRTSIHGMFRQARSYGRGGVAVHLAFYPDTKFWIWWGLYARWVLAVLRLPFSMFRKSRFDRLLPFLDIVRYTGLSLGRIEAGIRSRRIIA